MTATAAWIDDADVAGSSADDGQAARRASSGVPDNGRAAAWDSDLAALGRRLARPVSGRGIAEAAIDLDVPGAWASASWRRSEGCVHLAIAMDGHVADGPCRKALAVVLRRAAQALVGVTLDETVPALIARADESDAGIEAVVAAVEALTVAARMVVMEAEALLADESLARRYLAQQAAGS